MNGVMQGSSFSKGLGVLTWVLDHEGTRADEIAPALGIPLSSVYRYLRSLRENDLVAEREGLYSASSRLVRHGAGGLRANISTIAAPYLEHLSAVTGETAVLTVRRGLHAVCVSQVESAHQIRLAFELGQLLPLYAGAGQRVLLAFAPEEVQRAVLRGEIRAQTPNTPSRAELARVLARIRADGYALSRGELYAASVAIAMPILKGQNAIAGVCLAGPQNRCNVAWRDSARQELATAVSSMAQSLADNAQ
ncbi:MAG: IclR family transcriptional regulator [Nakamurella sp.]